MGKNKAHKKPVTAGPGWFNMAAPKVTPELERDLRVLKLRDVIDPARHYKKLDNANPTFFQIGTVIDDPTDFYSVDRVTKKNKKDDLVDTLLKDANTRKYLKKKYGELQAVRVQSAKLSKRKGKKIKY